jgi:glycosyltransferase involved in cell wall biosynthesis
MPEGGRPLVSVIVNCFNGEQYLREALDSVSAQTVSEWEIVFWDNASTDGSGAIAREYAPRLRYFRAAETTPLGEARRLALQQARGEFLAFLDCDDAWLPGTLEHQLAAMRSGPVDVSYGGIIQVDASGRERGRVIPPARSGNLFAALLRQFDVYPPAMMIRKAALDETGLTFDPCVVASEEYCLLMQLAVTRQFRSISEPLAQYRIHDGALTSKSSERWAFEREYTLNRIIEQHRGIRERYAREFAEAFARARYYRARYHMSVGNRRAARDDLRPVVLQDFRYFALFCLLGLPVSAWHAVHRVATGR